ncbi:FAD-dependent oxidoreductase [Amycolatopsis mediterranei S699]|uniref:FAD-dependent oxidoreductase n=2 Tax=Amycolatopsis mediterranei TaxID=33910 RepID=A0A0H3DHF6_AMYMU|nr:FAD-binding oxidoreductase [Amycolatopsis mediterranei]AGT88405.1 FAD-dependent oxidoreductase [Amycolatopsis mediterranei RB]ADJ49568.1 FAD-dependent oxidoreductase [Amycolatopsis mediterranei U32]AEK46548.1 FAD-dependent oxidoreductase [Amycolatopsis mediterranei S699]AFO81277.1 FAD-dependent oxidoreductase [Amycolatopsis mediterranei S699]KDO12801.1 FAD-dependent oxidoreductase [Amycolatopsis mediterranei]
MLLLERGALGGGSTAKAAGGIRSSFTSRVNVELGLRGPAAYRTFSRDFGTEIDFRRDGYLYLVTDPADVPAFEPCAELQREYGVRSHLLDPGEAKKVLPLVETDGVRTAWAGLYEMTPDRNQIIGESVLLSRFFYATGFSGHGFQLGPATGELIRDLYLRRRPAVDIAELDVRRFETVDTAPAEHNIV